jgi:hypothetical protein
MRAQVPAKVLQKVRRICLELPEVQEQSAWVGTRWRIRTKTFAHVLMIDEGWPPHYVKATGSNGPLCVLTFRSSVAEFDPQMFTRRPFFKPVWWPDIAGLALDGRTDWKDVGKLLTASYCTLAPKKLVDVVRRTKT